MERLLSSTMEVKELESDHSEIQTFVSKVIDPKDPRGTEDGFLKAKKAEVEGIIKRGICKKVKRSSLPEDVIVQGGIFVMTLNNHLTPS